MHRVVIIGGGFGGLFAVRALKSAPVDVTLIDKRNFHLFQPLLYQVATGGLSPANIAAPLRELVKNQANAAVRLGEVTDIDVAAKQVCLSDGAKIGYDSLIVAAGAIPNYFGHDAWQSLAPALKSTTDARDIRRRILTAFEAADLATDETRRRTCLTFVVVGGGSTGVELAGSLAELAHYTLKRDFRKFDPGSARILLVEGGDRILSAVPEKLAEKAAAALKRLGVEIKTGAMITDVKADGVSIKTGDRVEQVHTLTVLWGAGVRASPLGKMVGSSTQAKLDKEGRVFVQPDLTVAAHPEIFVIGDLARFEHQTGKPLPGVAQVAMQQGSYAATMIRNRLRNETTPAFRYHDRGSLTVIGRNSAIADLGWIKFSGFMAWLIWVFIHLTYLVHFQNRVLVLAQWMWNYVTRNRSALLIPEEDAVHNEQPATH